MSSVWWYLTRFECKEIVRAGFTFHSLLSGTAVFALNELGIEKALQQLCGPQKGSRLNPVLLNSIRVSD